MNAPLRVLIVEDEAIVLMQLEMLLEDAGHEIVGTAMTAREAIERAAETQPDLMFIDLRLKDGSSGLDVARAVRAFAGTTTVFITANAAELTVDMEGAAAVIPKPFSSSALEGSIAYLEECVRRPPPIKDLPEGMRLAPHYLAHLEGLRAAP